MSKLRKDFKRKNLKVFKDIIQNRLIFKKNLNEQI